MGSGGVGWTTGYQDYEKTYLGHVDVMSPQNGVRNTPEFVFVNVINLFVNILCDLHVDPNAIIESFRWQIQKIMKFWATLSKNS